MKKRIVSLLLIACLLLALVPAAALPSRVQAATGLVIEPGTWYDVKDTSLFDDTSVTEYTITTAEQLAGLAYLVTMEIRTFYGYTVRLGDDIDLAGRDWVPIDCDMTYNLGAGFWGTFDGDGHTVSNMTITRDYDEAGFFGRCDGVLKNLRLTNIFIKTSSGKVGGIAGAIQKADDEYKRIIGTMLNCYVDGEIEAESEFCNGDIGLQYPGTTASGNDCSGVRIRWNAKYWKALADTGFYDRGKNGNYEIRTAEELAGLIILAERGETFAGKTVHILDDIDLNGHLWSPISRFEGTFRGNEHLIYGLKIAETGGVWRGISSMGLFGDFAGEVWDAYVLGDISVDLTDCTRTEIGMFAGRASGKIHGVHAIGTITVGANQKGAVVSGGVTGYYTGELVDYCVDAVEIRVHAGKISGDIGGIIGRMEAPTLDAAHTCLLERCYTLSSIESSAFYINVGGLVGSYQERVGQTGAMSLRILNCGVQEGVRLIGRDDMGGFANLWAYNNSNNLTIALTVENSYCNAAIGANRAYSRVAGIATVNGTDYKKNFNLTLDNVYMVGQLNHDDAASIFYNWQDERSSFNLSFCDVYLTPANGTQCFAKNGKLNNDVFKGGTFGNKKEQYVYLYDQSNNTRIKIKDAGNPKKASECVLVTRLNETRKGRLEWTQKDGYNGSKPYFPNGPLQKFEERSFVMSAKFTANASPEAALGKTDYYDLTDQPDGQIDEEFLLRVERTMFNPKGGDKLILTNPLPAGARVTIRKVNADRTGYEPKTVSYIVQSPQTDIPIFELLKTYPDTGECMSFDVSVSLFDCGLTSYETQISYYRAGSDTAVPQSAKTIRLAFLRMRTVIAVAEGEGGTVSPTQQEVVSGRSAAVMIVPDTGYRIARVRVERVEDENVSVPADGGQLVLQNITSNTTVMVAFEKKSYTVRPVGGEGFTFAPSGETTVRYGEDFSFSLNLLADYRRDTDFAVLANGVPLTPVNGAYQLTDIRQNTEITVRGVVKMTAVTGTVSVGDHDFTAFEAAPAFDTYLNGSRTVTIRPNDPQASAYYVLSSTALAQSDMETQNWLPYSAPFDSPNAGNFIVYVKLTDPAGNISYLSTDGFRVDTVAPTIDGLTDGHTYCAAVSFTVSDNEGVERVTLGGNRLFADNAGQYTLTPKAGAQTVTVYDKAGNAATVTVTVNDGHTAGADDGDCTTPILCLYCQQIAVAAQAHDFTGEWLHDADGHWHACRNADCDQIDGKAAHTATDDGDCTTALVCECGYVIKAAQTHDFGGEWLRDADGHWHVCRDADCEQIDGKVAHAATDDGDCSTALVCECGYVMKAAQTHDFGGEWLHGADGHWHACRNADCDQIDGKAAHAATDDGDCSTALVCECGYVMKTAQTHDFGGEWLHDADGHWHACRDAGCDQIDGKAAHTATDDGDCSTALVCECGYVMKAAQAHDFGGEWLHDADGHWHACRNADCTQINGKAAHTATDDGDCSTALVCECGYVIKAAQTHDFGAWGTNGNGTHSRSCQNAACTATETEACADGVATCTERATCARCGAPYGDVDAAHHTGTLRWAQTDKTHKQTYDCCGAVVINEAAHTWKDGECVICRYGCVHSGGVAACIAKAVCSACGEAYGEVDPTNHTALTHIPAKAATTEAEGYIEHWYCAGCGKYYRDAAATEEVDPAKLVTEKLPVETTTTPTTTAAPTTTTAPLPVELPTGEDNAAALWFALALISGGMALASLLFVRKKATK